jgi:DNA invertase Pin-like site-specific DNA recombinase
MTHTKIKPNHLSRNAYVYVRQSTQHQVQHHLESQQRQYELRHLAQTLGFSLDHVVVIDDDLGVSASGRADRAGFERLVSDVALGRAGLVLGLEVSRLARNNRDWYELLDLCAMRDTLIGDGDGVYDPAAYNDRLLLGLKGTMSEAELHILKARMLAGMQHKAEKGELRFRLAPGYEFDEGGGIVKTNDEQVAQFIELLFDKLFEIGSISGLTKFLLHEGLQLPRRERSGGRIRWEQAYYRAVFTMITNPIYAGIYAYGRSETVTDVDAQGSRKTRRRFKAMADWDVVLHDHHPAYISRETFQRVQQMVARNRASKREQASTVLREGTALLQGIVRCGYCGRSMTVSYHGRANRRSVPHYGCMAALAQHRAGVCQSMGGYRIDQAISQVFLETLASAQLEAQLVALRKLDDQQDAVLQQLQLQRERASFEANRVERQYNAVEPENRVVARTLETRWNEALAKVSELDTQISDRQRLVSQKLSDSEQRQLLELAAHLPRLWSHEKVSDRDRKSLLRTAIEEVQLRKEERIVNAKVIWKGGAITETSIQLINLPPPPPTPPDLVDLVRELAKRYTDSQIAGVLIRRRIKTPKRHLTFTARHVGDLRRSYDIPRCPDPSPDPTARTYTVDQTARLLNVSPPTVYLWLKLGVLVGEQVTAQAPWQIQLTDADRNRLTPEPPPGWLTLSEAARELAISKQTLLNWVKARKIAYVYVVRGRRSGLRFDINSAPQRKQQRLLD